MAQDIRELFKRERGVKNQKMPAGHEKKFIELLDDEIPLNKKEHSFLFLKIAASIVVLVTVSVLVFNGTNTVPAEKVTIVDLPKDNSTLLANQLTLGDISPELKEVENYYVANINLELLDLDIGGENKKIIDLYLNKLGELNDEYKTLTKELNEIGPNEQTINALINNLQLRLQLLERLKEKLKELKNIENETYTDPQV